MKKVIVLLFALAVPLFGRDPAPPALLHATTYCIDTSGLSPEMLYQVHRYLTAIYDPRIIKHNPFVQMGWTRLEDCKTVDVELHFDVSSFTITDPPELWTSHGTHTAYKSLVTVKHGDEILFQWQPDDTLYGADDVYQALDADVYRLSEYVKWSRKHTPSVK